MYLAGVWVKRVSLLVGLNFLVFGNDELSRIDSEYILRRTIQFGGFWRDSPVYDQNYSHLSWLLNTFEHVGSFKRICRALSYKSTITQNY